jgi:hypothetical protein
VDALIEEIDAWEKEETIKGPPSTSDGRVRLPVLQ